MTVVCENCAAIETYIINNNNNNTDFSDFRLAVSDEGFLSKC